MKSKLNEEVKSKFLELFLDNLELALVYISTHYPFKYDFLVNHWDSLIMGKAHYCVFLPDNCSIYPSEFGLSFNKNIKWNSKLKAKFDYGFVNPFEGYIEGNGGEPVEVDERDYLDHIIPLDLKEEIKERNSAYLAHWTAEIAPHQDFDSPEGFEEPTEYDISELFKTYGELNFEDFSELFLNKSLVCIVNSSIWRNTLQYILDDEFIEKIINSNN